MYALHETGEIRDTKYGKEDSARYFEITKGRILDMNKMKLSTRSKKAKMLDKIWKRIRKENNWLIKHVYKTKTSNHWTQAIKKDIKRVRIKGGITLATKIFERSDKSSRVSRKNKEGNAGSIRAEERRKSIVTKLNATGEQEEIAKGNEDNGLFHIVFTRPKSK